MVKLLGIISIILISCSPVHADSLYLGGWSQHVAHGNGYYEFNSNHKIVALEYNSLIVGHFFNSYDKSTWFATKRLLISKQGYLTLNLHTGITYGYRSCDFSNPADQLVGEPTYCPMIAPEISYNKYMIKPTLVIIGNALAVTFNISF